MKKILIVALTCISLTTFGQIDTVNNGHAPGDGTGEGLYYAFGKVNNAIKEIDTVVIKTSGYVVPQLFGAVGDGLTDDSTPIQNAINYAQSNNLALYIPSGVYKASGLIVSDTLTIYGNGNESVIYTDAGSTIIEVMSDGFRLYDLQLRGSGNGSDIISGQKGLVINTSMDYKINRCTVRNFGEIGVQFSGFVVTESFAGTITNCYMLNCRIGVQIDNRHEYVSFNNNVVNGSGNVGLYLLAGNVTITGGYITQCGSGIYVVSGTNDSHSTITGVLLNHNTNGLVCDGIALGMAIANCQFHSTTMYMLNSTGVLVSGCEFGSATLIFDGSETHMANNVMLAGNTINEDYNGHASSTLWSGTTHANDAAMPFLIQSSTTTDTAFIVRNKAGTIVFGVLDNGTTF